MFAYLASPMDAVTDEQRHALAAMREEAIGYLVNDRVAVYNPASKPFSGAAADAERCWRVNEFAIECADGLLGLLPEGVASVGVPMEIQTAVRLGRPVAVVTTKWSMQLEGMGVRTFETTKEAAEWLVGRMRGRAGLRRLQGALRVSLGDLRLDEWQGATVASYMEDEAEPELRWVGRDEYEPVRQYDGDAGFDLVVSQTVHIPFQEFRDVPLGVSVELPSGVWGMLTGRSSTLRKRGLLVTQGIIDQGYRGPLFAGVQNMSNESVTVEAGERIAQLIPLPVLPMAVEQVEELSPSDRGTNAFGSTGGFAQQ